MLVIDEPSTVDGASRRLEAALGRSAEVVAATTFAGAEATADRGGTVPVLVLFEPCAAACDDLAELDRLRVRFPETRFAAFSRSNSAFDARRLLRAGLHGYLPREAPPAVLRAAIELVLAGGLYLPPCLLLEGIPEDIPAPAAGGGAAGRRTSDVELRGTVFRRVLHPDGRLGYDYIRVLEPSPAGLAEDALQRQGTEVLLAAMHPADRPVFRASLLASARNLSQHYVEYRLPGPDGRYHWFRSVSRPFQRDDGAVVWDGYCCELGPDRRDDPAAQDREGRLRGILDRMFQLVGLLSPEGVLLEVNQTALDFGGLSYADVIGKPFSEAAWWSPSERQRDALRHAVERAARGEFVRYEVDVRDRGGRTITIDFSIKPVFDDTGQVAFLIAEGRDVTRLLLLGDGGGDPTAEVEGRLRDSGRRLATIVANLPGALFRRVVGPHGGEPSFLFYSHQLADLIGVTPAEAQANPAAVFERVHPDDLPGYLAAIEESQRALRPLNRTVRLFRRPGELRWLRVVAQPWRTQGGDVVTDGFMIDVTEQHEAEERLRESERSLDAIAANLPGVVFRGVVEPDGSHRFTYVSPSVARFAGVTPEEALADPERVFATIHPDDRERHRRAVRERITNPDVPDHEFRIIRPDGAVRLLRSIATTRREPDGRVVIDGVALDVTEQRDAEERLAGRERVLAALAGNLPAVVLRCVHGADGSSRCAFIAGDLERLTGLSAQGVLDGSRPLSSRVHPSDRAAYLAAYDRAAADLAELDHEYRFIKPDGEVRWLRWIGRASPAPAGGAYVDGVVLDITEHRTALEELDRRNRELLALVRISEIALKSPDLDAGLCEIVEEIGRFTGFDAVAIGLFDESRQTIDYRARRRFDSERFEGRLQAPVEETLVGDVIRTGQPLVERRCLERRGRRFTRMHQFGDQTFLGVPVRVGERVIGSFHVTSQRDVEIGPDLIELASSWADYIASFIASQGRREVPALLRPERRSEAFEAAFACLTPRQRDVLAELAKGKSNRDIAAGLGLQEPTVKIHVRAILKALGAANRTQAANIANAAGRVDARHHDGPERNRPRPTRPRLAVRTPPF